MHQLFILKGGSCGTATHLPPVLQITSCDDAAGIVELSQASDPYSRAAIVSPVSRRTATIVLWTKQKGEKSLILTALGLVFVKYLN